MFPTSDRNEKNSSATGDTTETALTNPCHAGVCFAASRTFRVTSGRIGVHAAIATARKNRLFRSVSRAVRSQNPCRKNRQVIALPSCDRSSK